MLKDILDMNYSARYKNIESAAADISSVAKVFNDYNQRLKNVSLALGAHTSLSSIRSNIAARASSVGAASSSIAAIGKCLSSINNEYINAEQRAVQLFGGRISTLSSPMVGTAVVTGVAATPSFFGGIWRGINLFDSTVGDAVDGGSMLLEHALDNNALSEMKSVKGLGLLGDSITLISAGHSIAKTLKDGINNNLSSREIQGNIAGEALYQCVRVAARYAVTKGSIATGAALGTVLIPIPVVGTFVGGAIGLGFGLVTNWVLTDRAVDWLFEKTNTRNYIRNIFSPETKNLKRNAPRDTAVGRGRSIASFA
jgi:hypothetical protein